MNRVLQLVFSIIVLVVGLRLLIELVRPIVWWLFGAMLVLSIGYIVWFVRGRRDRW